MFVGQIGLIDRQLQRVNRPLKPPQNDNSGRLVLAGERPTMEWGNRSPRGSMRLA